MNTVADGQFIFLLLLPFNSLRHLLGTPTYTYKRDIVGESNSQPIKMWSIERNHHVVLPPQRNTNKSKSINSIFIILINYYILIGNILWNLTSYRIWSLKSHQQAVRHEEKCTALNVQAAIHETEYYSYYVMHCGVGPFCIHSAFNRLSNQRPISHWRQQQSW